MEPGPRTREQLARLDANWEQGEHVLVTGPTKSGKTALARHIVQKRADHGGFVVVLAAKPRPDETLVKDYKDFTRWTTWKKSPSVYERKILLWPDVSKMHTKNDIVSHQKKVFGEAFDSLFKTGHWTVQVDEGLYTCDPSFLNMSDHLAMGHAIGRTSGLTFVTLAQRPAHLPLIVYSSAQHVFVGRARELADLKRLQELGGKESSRELAGRIANQQRHEFTWIPVGPDWPAETIDLKK